MNKEKILFRSSFKIINMISWIRFTISLFYLMKFFWGKNKLTHKIIKKKKLNIIEIIAVGEILLITDMFYNKMKTIFKKLGFLFNYNCVLW